MKVRTHVWELKVRIAELEREINKIKLWLLLFLQSTFEWTLMGMRNER